MGAALSGKHRNVLTYLPCISRSNALGASSNAKTESRIGWMDSVIIVIIVCCCVVQKTGIVIVFVPA
jgi:hypothetical protein